MLEAIEPPKTAEELRQVCIATGQTQILPYRPVEEKYYISTVCVRCCENGRTQKIASMRIRCKSMGDLMTRKSLIEAIMGSDRV